MASVKPNGQLNVGTQTRRLQGSAENKAEKLRGLSQNWRILTSLSLYQSLFFSFRQGLENPTRCPTRDFCWEFLGDLGVSVNSCGRSVEISGMD